LYASANAPSAHRRLSRLCFFPHEAFVELDRQVVIGNRAESRKLAHRIKLKSQAIKISWSGLSSLFRVNSKLAGTDDAFRPPNRHESTHLPSHPASTRSAAAQTPLTRRFSEISRCAPSFLLPCSLLSILREKAPNDERGLIIRKRILYVWINSPDMCSSSLSHKNFAFLNRLTPVILRQLGLHVIATVIQSSKYLYTSSEPSSGRV